MMFNGGWVVKSLLDNYPNLKGKWGTALPPAGPGGLVVYGYPNAWCISKQAVEKGTANVAWEFLKWFVKSKYYNQYAAACGTSSWKKDFTEAYYPGNEDLYKPFVKDAIPYSRPAPYTPKWEEFRQKYLNPILQDLILGKITVDNAIEALTKGFAELHPS
jgi:ABC-type glycerol-3-phosphate transport system substrate-binding protein